MRVLHKISGGYTYKAHTMILLKRSQAETKYIELKNTTPRAINGSLEVRVGVNPEELGTLSQVHDSVCWKGKRKVVQWGL